MPALPPFAGFPVIYESGAQRMELVVNRDGSLLQVSSGLTIRR
jgi:hypothetical protein